MRQKASSGQLRMIYGLAKRAGIDNDLLHDIAARLCRCESLAELSKSDGIRIINYLKRQCGEPVAEPTERLTPAQFGKITALAGQMGWSDDPKRLRGFCGRMAGVADVRFLSPAQAGIIIEAMKRMQAEGRAERRSSS